MQMTLIVAWRAQKHRYVVEKLVVLLIWPMQERTNLSHNEVKALEDVGFMFNKQQPIFLEACSLGRTLFQLID
jgi:hypothetical protein